MSDVKLRPHIGKVTIHHLVELEGATPQVLTFRVQAVSLTHAAFEIGVIMQSKEWAHLIEPATLSVFEEPAHD